jgi:hypothetical protein
MRAKQRQLLFRTLSVSPSRTLPFFLLRSQGSIAAAGWHFSYFFSDPAKFVSKLESFSHQEYNTEGVKADIEANIDLILSSGRDLFKRADDGSNAPVYPP